MVTDTEAMRAKFERKIGEAAPFPVERDGDSYVNRVCAWAWEGYQAGHAAAKAETAVAAGPENDMQYLVDEFEKSLPPMGHPLRKLGVRLTELLDEDQWAECERLLLEGWEHDAAAHTQREEQ